MRTKSFKEAVTDLTRELARVAAQSRLQEPRSAVTGALGGGGGALPIAKMGGLYANDGRLGAGKWGIAGEAGSEIIHAPANITPIRRSDIGPAGGGTSFAPACNIDARGADAGAVQRIEAALAQRDRALPMQMAAMLKERQRRKW